nr:MAG TPA: hypothetical protein [Caudoviricetes sp.]
MDLLYLCDRSYLKHTRGVLTVIIDSLNLVLER